MKKLVIINFDDMFVNVTKIICKLINSLKEIKENGNEIHEYDIGCDLEKPLPSLFYSVLEDCSIPINVEEISNLEKEFSKILIEESILANGIQTFIKECKKLNIEVRVITNKPYEAVKKCVEHYTFNLVNGVDYYHEPHQGIKLIEKLLRERDLLFKDVLIISNTDFNDEFLTIYEYSKEYCSKNVFDDYEDAIDLLKDQEMDLPLLSVSLDITVKNEFFNKVHSLVKDVAFNIDTIECDNKEDTVIILNLIEKICDQNDENSMYIENIIEECISTFYDKEELLKTIKEEYSVEYFLNCVIYVDSSKVNPCISPNKKIVEFLAKNDIQLDYDLYC